MRAIFKPVTRKGFLFMLLLLASAGMQDLFAQCGNANTFTPTVNMPVVCSGNMITVMAPGLPVKRWVYRDNNTGAWQVNFTSSSTLNDYPSVSSTVTRTYRAVVSTNTCPTDTTLGVDVTVTPLSYGTNNNIRVSASASAVCAGTQVYLNALSVPGTIQYWVYRNNNTGSWTSFSFSTESAQDNNTLVAVPTLRTYRALVKMPNSCQVDSSATVSVMISPPVFGNNNNVRPTANNSSVCSGTNVSLNVEWGSSLVAGWIYRNNGIGTWTVFGSSSINVNDGNTTVTVPTVRAYRALLRNSNSCNVDTSDATNVTINPPTGRVVTAIVPTYTGNSPVCAGSGFNVQLNGNYLSQNVIRWISRDSSNGSWVLGSSSTTSGFFSTSSSINKIINREVRVVVNNVNMACTVDTSGPVFVTIKPQSRGNTSVYMPLVSNATICSGVQLQVYMSTSNVTVNGWYTRNNNTGPWTLVSSGGTYFDNNTNVTANTTRSYRALVSSSMNCTADTTAEVSTLIKLPATGGNTAITPKVNATGYCAGSSASGSITLASQQGVAKWLYRDNNSGPWIDMFQTGTSFFDNNTGIVTTPTIRAYRALVRNNETCSLDSSNEVTTMINPLVRGTQAGTLPVTAAPYVCASAQLQMSIAVPSGYSVQNWIYRDSVINGWSSFGFGASSTSDGNTFVSYNRVRTYRVLMQNSTLCRFDTSAAVMVNVNTKVRGTIGITPTTTTPSICGGLTSVSVQVGVPSGSSVQKWVYRDNNTGAWTQVPNSSNSTNYNDQQVNTGVLVPTTRSYRAIVDNNNSCTTDTTAAVNVTITPVSAGSSVAITPSLSGNSTVCNGSSFNMFFSYSGTVQKWIYSDNGGMWYDVNYSTSSSLYENNVRLTVPTARQYRAVIYRTGTCLVDTTQTVSVNINPYTYGNVSAPAPVAGSTGLCSGTAATVNLTLSGSQNVQKWIYRNNYTGEWLDFTSSTQSSYLNDANTTVSATTVRSYRAIIAQPSCGYDTTPVTNVTINTPVQGNQLSATPTSSTPIICSGSTLSLSVSGTGSVRKWIYSDNAGPWFDVPSSASTFVSHSNTAVNSSTSRAYRALFASTTCSIDSSALYSVTINPNTSGNISNTPIATSGPTFCASLSGGVSLSASIPSGYIVKKWIFSDNGGPWTDFAYGVNSPGISDYNTNVPVSLVRSYRAIASNATTCSLDTTASVSVTINANLRGNIASVTPASTRSTYCYGIGVPLTVSLPSGSSVVKWLYRNNSGPWLNLESGSTSSSVTDNNTYVGAATTRSYAVILFNQGTCSSDTTSALNVTINSRSSGTGNTSTTPTTSNPSVCSGSSVSLNISPTGGNSVYKWIYSNTGAAGPWYDVLSSMNQNGYTHNNTVVQSTVSRLYRAILTDTSTCDYDSSATVTVTINPIGEGNDTNIVISTSQDTVCTGTQVSISTSVSSGSSVQKWIYRDNNTGPWMNFAFATSTSSLFDNTTVTVAISSRSYRVIQLRNSTCTNDTSNARTVYFRGKTTSVVTTQPNAGTDTICSGSIVSLSISSGSGVDGWLYRDGNGPWIAIPGSASSAYSHSNTTVPVTTLRYYRALLNPGSCRVDSSAIDSVLLRIQQNGNNNAVVPTISNTTVCTGNYAALSVSVPSGSTIQKWMYRDNNTGAWTDFAYGNSSSATDYNTSVSSTITRSYRVLYLKSCSYDTSGALTITIAPRTWTTNTGLVPTSANSNVCAGSPVSSISISPGSGNTIMKWIFRNNNTGPWLDLVNGNINNVTDYNTYVGSSINRFYRAIVVNNTTCSFDTSASLQVIINPVAVGNISAITPTSSTGNSICTGSALTINVSPGGGNQVVRWAYNVNGGAWTDWGYNTSTSITDYNTSVSSSTTRGYRALIYQPASCRIDSTLALSVTINPRTYGNSSVTPTAGSSTVCYGSSNTMQVGSGTVSKWIYRDNNTGPWLDIAGSTNAFTDYNYATVTTTRSYRAMLSSTTCTFDTTLAVNVTLSPLSYGNDNTILPVSTTSVCSGSGVSINVSIGTNTIESWLYRDNYAGTWNVLTYNSAASITDYNTNATGVINRVYRVLVRKSSTCNIDTSSADTTVISPRLWGNDNTIVPVLGSASSICTGTMSGANVAPGSGNNVVKWLVRNNGGAWMDFYVGVNTFIDDYNTQVSTTTVRSYRAIIKKGSLCTNDSTAIVSVTINPRANGNDNALTPTSPSTSYCSGSYITVNAPSGSGGAVAQWLYMDNNNGVWLNWNVGVGTSVTDYNTGVSTATTRSYRVIIAKSNGCNLDTSAALNVTINPIGFGNQNTVAPVASSVSICSGASVSMSVSGFTGSSVLRWLYRDNGTGTWNVIYSASSSITDYNTSVTSSTVRSYRAIINNSGNCSTDTTAQVNVTFNPITNGLNATAAQTGSAAFCSGNPVNVFINTPSGFSITSWLYNDNGNGWIPFTASTSASVYDYATVVTAASSRMYRALLRNTSGCSIDSSATVTVTINPLSAGNNNTLVPGSSTPTICSGTTAVISLSGFSGTVIRWLYRDSVVNSWSTYGSIATTIFHTNTSVSYDRTRAYRAIVYNASNCSNDTTGEVTILIRQQLAGNATSISPTSGSGLYCSGTTVSVNATGFANGGAVTGWLYSDNSGAWIPIAGSAVATYNHTATTVTAQTLRSYRALVLTGCNTDTTAALTVVIDIYPAKPVISRVSATDSLASSVSGISYTWKNNGTAVSGNTQRILAPASGNYTVEVVNASGCKTLSDPFNFAKTGVDEVSLQQFTSVYPNPNETGILYVSLTNMNAPQVHVQVYDILGKVIMEKSDEIKGGSSLIELDIRDANAGIYFVTVSAGRQSVTKKIVVNK